MKRTINGVTIRFNKVTESKEDRRIWCLNSKGENKEIDGTYFSPMNDKRFDAITKDIELDRRDGFSTVYFFGVSETGIKFCLMVADGRNGIFIEV